MTKERREQEENRLTIVSDAFFAAAFCAMLVPAALWNYSERIVLAATFSTFGAVWLFGIAAGVLCTVIRGLRERRKLRKDASYRVEYVTRQTYDEDRRLGYVSAEQVCRASQKGGEEK